ncbi:nucleotidyltransferase domain-containing protein [Chengkuizengella sp. SCS-71B]|uniref:nucleotidyltransferase domain-containing protein n=1 Tax=Chengkuizengella sp. SCS-71B TaxID=3115290 RepID=UPI0032C24A58
MDINAFLEKVKTHLKQKYECHTIILYGSYNTGDYSEDSDIDIICFTDKSDDQNEVELFEGKQLDVWIYNTNKMRNHTQYLRVNKGKILFNDKGLAERFLSEIEKVFNEGPKKLSTKEKEFLKTWLRKMKLRSNNNDIEGNYRFHWMLKDSLEIYFELKGLWYLGPKKSFNWLYKNDKVAYNLFKNAFEKNKNTNDIEQLLEYLYEI